MKKSNYLLFTSNSNGDFVVFNCLNKKMIKVSSKNKEQLLLAIEGNLDNDSLNKYLIDNGFLVVEGGSEILLAENIYQKTCQSTDKLHVIILPTYQCNFRCSYCYENFLDVTMDENTQDEVCRFIEKQLYKYNSLEISWFGGEPLLAFDVILRMSEKLQKICKTQKKPYQADITTNGYLLTNEVFSKLLRCNIRVYQVTIDGLANTHNKYRHLINGDQTYETIMNNLISIRDNVKSTMFKIVIRTNLTKELTASINDHFIHIEKTFLNDARFKHVCRIAFSYNNDPIKDELLNTENLINSSFSNLPQSIINEDNRDFFIESFRDFITGTAFVCYAGKTSSIVIDPEGKLMKCTVCLDDNKNEVGDIYKGLKIEKFNKWVERPKQNDDKIQCIQCPIYPICLNVSCPYEHFSQFKRKERYCSSKIKDTLLYIQTLSFDSKMCELIDFLFCL